MFKTKNKLLFVVLLFMISFGNAFSAVPNTLDSIKMALKGASDSLVQEKVYVHIDNTCYFVGDTIWYKAYVVRADNLKFTDMSRILYVELLSPDGVVVERQHLIVSPKGYTCGDFELKDSLYSGFYEIRAYTRWMLNFNVTEHPYARKDREAFYNFKMAHDYYRQYDALYSRVFPVYSKPDSAGDYLSKRMYARYKQQYFSQPSEKLTVKFYPEGGHIIKGVSSRIAFEATDQEGKDVDVKGTVSLDGTKIADISTTYMGRGIFTVKASDERMKASFVYKGKNYSFDLPKSETAGAAIQLSSDNKLMIETKGLSANEPVGISVLCRGSLKLFDIVRLDNNGNAGYSISDKDLPTGINDLTLFDSHGRVLADRLFFVNHHDYDGNKISLNGIKQSYDPYEKITLKMKCEGVAEPMHFSVAVRDNISDENSYDDGDMMTDMLLSSELKGFIGYPHYYFEKDDATHRQALDLLMMVQGWRRYNWEQIADTAYHHTVYRPETMMTVEGGVYKMVGFDEVTQQELSSWILGRLTKKISDDEEEDSGSLLSNTNSDDTSTGATGDSQSSGNTNSSGGSSSSGSSNNFSTSVITDADSYMGVNQSGLDKEVMVKADLVVDTMTATSEIKTKDDKFIFKIPPFYGNAILFLSAHDIGLTPEKMKKKEENALNEDYYSDYFVKRDLFFPVFANKYSYYESHFPEWKAPVFTPDSTFMSDGVHQLENVTVKGKKKGRRTIDFTKPAWVGDAYDVYNDVTDYGLSFGKLNFRQFPYQICCWLYGNMGRYRRFNVDARINDRVFYRSYMPDTNDIRKTTIMRSNYSVFKDLKLKRLQDIRIFTDYEPRNENAPYESRKYEPDFTIDFVTVPDDGERYTYRDRRYILRGFTYPDAFYSPDYSNTSVPKVNDYRRTLYWNPNAMTDAEGNFEVSFYNNSKKTEIKVNAEGLSTDGKIMVGKN